MLMSRMTRSGGFANHLHGVNAVVRLADNLVILVFQQHTDGQADDGMVVDDKYGMHVQLPCGLLRVTGGTLSQLKVIGHARKGY